MGAERKTSLKAKVNVSGENNKNDSPTGNITHNVMWVQEAQKWAFINSLMKAIGKKM